MPLPSTPTIALPIFKTQNMETFVETLPRSQLLPLPGPDSQPDRSGWRSRPIAKSLQGIKSTLDGQFQNLVMTMLENPHLEVANCICICTPRTGQDRGRPLSNHPRIGLPAAANKAAWKNGQTPPARRPRTPSRLPINVQTAIRNTGNVRLTLSPAHHTAVPTSSPHLQHSGRCVWPCFAHRPRPSTHHRHHRPAAVRGGPPAPPETNARVSRVPTALPATPPERTFSLFIFAPFCADGRRHAAKFAPGS